MMFQVGSMFSCFMEFLCVFSVLMLSDFILMLSCSCNVPPLLERLVGEALMGTWSCGGLMFRLNISDLASVKHYFV